MNLRLRGGFAGARLRQSEAPGSVSSGYTWGMNRRFMLAVAVLVALVAVAEALGCPNCKDAVDTSDPEGLNLARGYFYSILLMLAMPFTLAGSFGCYVWREMRRQQREQAEGGPPPTAAAEP